MCRITVWHILRVKPFYVAIRNFFWTNICAYFVYWNISVSTQIQKLFSISHKVEMYCFLDALVQAQRRIFLETCTMASLILQL